MVSPPRVPFRTILTAVATVYAITLCQVIVAGRQRALVPARAMPVSRTRQWSDLTVREIAQRLHRDPSMISRLAATYAAAPDHKLEAHIRRVLHLKPSA